MGYNNQGIQNTVSNSVSTQISKVDYDRLDRPVKVTRANKGVVNQTFDNAGRLLTRSQADGGLETFEWGSRGLDKLIFKETSSITHTNSFGYDELYRRTSVTNANNEVVSYTYNAAGGLLTLTDGAGQETSWVYDTEGNVILKRDDDSTAILAYTWDDNHRMTGRWSKEMLWTYYTYDNNGNLTNVNYPSGTTDISYSYDDLDRLSSMTDDVGTTSFTYNGDGRLATENGPWASDTLTYTYTDGYRTEASLLQATGTWDIDYTYDANGRMDTVVSDSGTFDYDYVGASRDVDDLTLPSSRFIDYDYDTVGRIDETILKMSSGGAVIKKHTYDYNLAGWKTDHTIYTGGTADRDYSFDYDDIGQLEFADDANTTLDDFEYVYDAAWNLDERFVDETSENFTVDNLNQLTSHSAACDDNGNIESQGTGSTLETYTYNAENQLVSVRYYTSYPTFEAQIDYTYDGLGRLRVREFTFYNSGSPYSSVEYRFVYDGRNVIQERYSSNSVKASYTRGMDLSGSLQGAGGIGGLLARNWGSNNAFYHCDVMGNVTTLINSSGTVMGSYAYDPYGSTISQSGAWAGVNTYRFSSKEQEINGLYYYGFRFYDPNLQRWLNRDPIGEAGGINLYGFVGNTPVGRIDPHGLHVAMLPPTNPWIIDPFNPKNPFLDFSADLGAGFGDGLTLNTTMLGRGMLGIDSVDPCSNAYKAGALGSLGVGLGRVAYAVAAKVGSRMAATGAAASGFRERLKFYFRAGTGKNFRKPNLAGKTDEGLRRSAGKTNKRFNAWGAGIVAASLANLFVPDCQD